MTLVDGDVTRVKFNRELAAWQANPDRTARGWILLSVEDAVPAVEVAFLAKLSVTGNAAALPAVVCAVRISYDNYDLLPPSVMFIDVFTRKAANPQTRAILGTPEGPRDVLIDAHPATLRPFLCVPGVREYHDHPQHTGDDWFLHRASRAGSLWTICDRIWRLMVRNVVGLNVSVQALPVMPMRAQVGLQLAQGDIEALSGLASPPVKAQAAEPTENP